MKTDITLTINGETLHERVEPRTSLADFLREGLGLTGTHLGCEMGVCGACLVLIDGQAVHSCLVLAVQADGQEIQTIEGLTETEAISELQAMFYERNALQCGFCTNGMLMTAKTLLEQNARPTRDEIRDALSGNYCRCTGYEAIVDAIEAVSIRKSDRKEAAQ